MSNRSKTSRIEDHEEEAAKEAVLSNYRKYTEEFQLPTPVGHRLVVALNVREGDVEFFKDVKTGKSSLIIVPKSSTANDKFMSCTGCVLAVGPDAYSDEKWYKSGPYCKVGDFISFPRHAGHQYSYMGIPVHNIPEDAPLEVLTDPEHVKLY